MWTLTLPAVKRSEPEPEAKKMDVIDKALETKLEDEVEDLAEKSIEVNRS